MPTADGSRKRTAGGVFFTLLKEHMEPAKLKELYADEIRVKKEKDRAHRSANKRKAMAALAGEDVMTPRDPPKQKSRENKGSGSGSGGGGGGSTRGWRDMGNWVGPRDSRDGAANGLADANSSKRARANMIFSGEGEGGGASRTCLP